MTENSNNTHSKNAFVLESIQMVITVMYWIIINVPSSKLPISYMLYVALSYILGILALAGMFTGLIGLHILKKAKKNSENNKYAYYAKVMSIINIVVGVIPIGIAAIIFLMIITSP